MKIFSLQSKTSLVVWSVVLGFVFNIFAMRMSIHYDVTPTGDYQIISRTATSTTGAIIDDLPASYSGWPVNSNHLSGGGFIVIDLLFWVLGVFIILSLIRYFKNRKQ